jgi:hypothetical protein
MKNLLLWLNIFENRQFYSLGDIMDEKKIRKFMIARSGGMMITFCGAISIGTYLFSNYAYDNLPSSYPRKISLIVASSLQSFIFFEAFYNILIMGVVLQAMKKSSTQNLFEQKCQRFQAASHLIAAINNNTKLIMTLVTVLLIVWILTNIIFLIFNIYALIDHDSYNFITINADASRDKFFDIGTFFIFLRP